MSSRPTPRLFLVRHGETEWSLNGRHTGTSDIPLTPRGESVVKHRAENAVGPSKLLVCNSLAKIFVSPRQRARKTFELLFSREGELPSYEITDAVREWDYGEYEGLVTSEIHKKNPTWEIFLDGCPGGESAEEMNSRVDSVISKVREIHRAYYEEGKGARDVLIVTHGHFSRCIIPRWLGQPLITGKKFVMEPGGIAILSYNHHNLDEPAIAGLNLYAF